ncbi:MAG: hypothetical protein IJF42_08335 [Clostridia bacterium]|nr:hypothetical protein [Clostridia bacterium]
MERLKKLTAAQAEAAVTAARQYAVEKGVPLTLERVAAQLGVSRADVRRWATAPPTGRRHQKTAALLKQVYLDCNADLIDELMACKSSHGGALLLAKNDFGYTDKGEVTVGFVPVQFIGEDRMED